MKKTLGTKWRGTSKQSSNPRSINRRVNNQRRGGVLLYVVLSIVLMLCCCALAVDYGLQVADANRLQRALDAAALAGAQDLKQSFDAADEFKARDTAVQVARENGVVIDRERDISFADRSTRINLSSRVARAYVFARIFDFISPGNSKVGAVTRHASALVTSCAAIDTPRVVPIGITWDTYGGLDADGRDHPGGYRSDWIQNLSFKDQPSRMVYRTLTLVRQNATVFGKDDCVLFDLRNSPSKSGPHFVAQLTGDESARASSSIGDYETTLNSSDSNQGARLSEAFSTIFTRASGAPWNDASASPIINADGNKYLAVLTGNSPFDSQGKPNPRVMSLVITPAPFGTPVNGSWDTQIQGYAPVYVKRAYATIDPITNEMTLKMDVGFLPPQNNSNGACTTAIGAAVSGQRIISLVE